MHFVDTNLLVYARDDADPWKRDRAREVMTRLWQTGNGRISHQVLVEFYATVTRKLKPGLPREDAMADVRELSAWKPVAHSTPLFERAWHLEGRYGFSWWDSLIVAAALASDSTTLLTEDLQHGLVIETLRVANPFHADFDLNELSSIANRPRY